MNTTIHPADADTLANASRPEDEAAHQVEDSGGKRQKLAEKATAVRDEARAQTADAVAIARDGLDEVQDKLAYAGRRTREAAERQPFLFAAGALALGVAVGIAIARRD